MSIYRRWPAENEPRLITTNTHQRRPIFRSAAACQNFVNQIYRVRADVGFLLLSFVIMPDHVHLILVPTATESGRLMHLIKGRFARSYNAQRGAKGSVWQSRFHEAVLISDEAFSQAMEYVETNPVAAGIVERPHDYRWSTACGAYETDLRQYLG